MARVLVTGATGFIGTPLVRALAREHEVVGVSRRDGDITDPATLDQFDRADHVFHLAARTFVPDAWKDPADFLRTNVLGTANVIAWCERSSAALTFVSAYIYGRPDRLPIDERTIPQPNNPYALSKHLAEQLCEFAARINGLSVTVVRPFNIYGDGQPDRFLIPSIIRQVKAGRAIRVKDLAPKRDYIHVDDLVNLLVATVTKRGERHRVINAGSGESHSVKEIVDLLQELAGTTLPVFDEREPRENEIDDVRADITVAAKELGWGPKVALRSGLERLLACGDSE